MSNLKEIVASLTDRLRSLELENQTLQQLTADIDWNDSALRSQFYSGLSSEIKDHLVHCETSISLSAAMDQAIRIDNRIVERRQEQQYAPRPFRRNPPPSHFVPRTNINQYSSRDYNLPVRQHHFSLQLFPLLLLSPSIDPRMTWTLICQEGSTYTR
ncbi:hypothetical protein BASA83_008256 [Batrachochytrium salamandrivorans]|nr:hypothetical protein BASA83_008256 [Batrachochytrium salamandrivorans]